MPIASLSSGLNFPLGCKKKMKDKIEMHAEKVKQNGRPNHLIRSCNLIITNTDSGLNIDAGGWGHGPMFQEDNCRFYNNTELLVL